MSTAPLTGKRIGLLTASASRLGGGVFEAVVLQAEMIRALGGEAIVYALADAHSQEDRSRFMSSLVRHAAGRGPAQIGFAPGLVDQLLADRLDLLHLHGIWMYPSYAGAAWARRSGRPYVISPHGMLDPWITGRGRVKKALARWGYEHRSWRRAAAFHALTSREARDITDQTGRSDSLVIANAGPPASPAPSGRRAPHYVYVGRIHPKKNLIALVQAWTRVNPGSEAQLTIAGWGDAASVEELHRVLAAAPPSASFIGPVYGAAKQELLETASFTVLPSLCEGLPMSVLEGWAAGAPAIMSQECNLPQAYALGAAIDCGFAPETIAAALRHSLDLSDAAWLVMSRAGLALAKGSFAAAEITRQWGEAYCALIADGERVSDARA